MKASVFPFVRFSSAAQSDTRKIAVAGITEEETISAPLSRAQLFQGTRGYMRTLRSDG